jgi:EmrB/QacA subfamily drug resistance transporter
VSAKSLCDRTTALGAAGSQVARPRLVLAATILASGLDYIDGSVVNVGLPAIGASLHASAADLQWVVNGYLLPLSALLLFGGALGDRFGRRRLLTLGTALFAAGSAGCALAPTFGWLVAARALQGCAAAMMLPNSLAVLGASFDGRQRSGAVGVWAASTAIATAIGPVLGGWLIDTVGWRAIFLINVPLAALAIAAALASIPRDPPAKPHVYLDLGGATLAIAAIGAATWGLTAGAGAGGWHIGSVGAVAAGAIFAAAYVAVERRLGPRAMTPLALFAVGPLAALNILTLLLYGVLSAFMLLLPFALITRVGYSATAAGAALLPFPLVMAVLSPGIGDLAGRIGARAFLIAGAALVAAGVLLGMLAAQPGGYVLHVLPAVLVVALGMACAAAPITAAVLGAVDKAHTGAASGLNSAVAQLGGVVAIALLGGVLARKGADFASAFEVAAVVGAIVAAAAAATVLAMYRPAAAKG